MEKDRGYITAGFLVPKENGVNNLEKMAKETIVSFKSLQMGISVAVSYENPNEQEHVETFVAESLKEFNPDGKYEMFINSRPADEGPTSIKDDRSI
ncbi:MAG: hypothetical protein ACD_50C00152G0005 [uncultured bacterium]|nr:MAG: hypothetical protein ACD_50C00152G0005 [uncultured bacterium]OGH14885.1 MAG: hypothetical protein A2687_04535 [Candidatus Levybacteria bacterium RIFCSPHIGHO2_01_FULL_38_26]